MCTEAAHRAWLEMISLVQTWVSGNKEGYILQAWHVNYKLLCLVSLKITINNNLNGYSLILLLAIC